MNETVETSMKLNKLKTSTLQNKLKKVNKDIEKAHVTGNYDKLDDLNLLKNQIEVELETR
ncbi:hypothetical protein P3U41_05715 [Mammaliicoccus sciuri]|uniref:hypothetical protein n=1 Tax=Mammaliicoccus sciuri TaxID=1296 RepID=UPI002B261045|nr:hypothetical protein [Mammaliicoccus sciuri]WQL34266.1 hypothetical protein P3U41_05715 [Mammaliicoccus sciuri]WQL61205.1 hypothetical protein P3T96_05715 [Mammaliicoccus sciuri]